jgi:MarR family transcriptional regulator, organic hydroperoxide resistance regulator
MTSPRAVEVDPLDELRFAVGRLLAADRRLRGRDQRRRGELSHAHVRALFVLMHEEEATAGTVAKAAELNPATVTAMIDQLEGAGLVQRRRDEQDRRVCWVSLTEAGRAQVAEKEQRWNHALLTAFADVDPAEIVAAGRVLDRVTDVLEQLGADAEDEPAEH